MKESDIKSALRRALLGVLPGAVVIRHEDQFTGGIPDISATWRGSTSWLEVKFKTGTLTRLQDLRLTALATAGAPCGWVSFKHAPKKRGQPAERLTVIHYAGREESFPGWDYAAVALLVREEHERREALQDQVAAFHRKFGVPVHPAANWDDLDARVSHVWEEASELEDAVIKKDRAAAADAVLDLAYLAVGAGLQLGLDFAGGFNAVHRTNMAKVRQELDNHKFGIGKPAGWTPPDLTTHLKKEDLP